MRLAADGATSVFVSNIRGDSDFSRDWDAMRADADIQFAPVEIPEQPLPPSWLSTVMDWLGTVLSPVARFLVWSWPVLFWVLIAIGVALLALVVLRLVDPATLRRRKKSGDEETDWTPDHAQALQLLEEADRLAAQGRYDEATRLLLHRSVGQIAAVRPDLIEPSSTAREIALLPALPDKARTAFAIIADRVERSLFALRKLGRDDWQAARDAYAEFALGYAQAGA